MVKDINTGGSSQPDLFTVVGSTLFFSAYDQTNGRELWKSDGSESGTTMVTDVGGSDSFVWSGSSTAGQEGMVALGNSVLFVASEMLADGTLSSYSQLWISDGTESGTSLVQDFNPFHSDHPKYMVEIGTSVYFSIDDPVHGRELWVTDGTASGTEMLSDLSTGGTGADPTNMVGMGGSVFFFADLTNYGRELCHDQSVITSITYSY